MVDPDAIPPQLLAMLRCPVGHSELRPQEGGLVCACGVCFPIREGIAALLIEEAALPEGISVDQLACRNKPTR